MSAADAGEEAEEEEGEEEEEEEEEEKEDGGGDEDDDEDDEEDEDGPIETARTLVLPLMVMGTLTWRGAGVALTLRLRVGGGQRIC